MIDDDEYSFCLRHSGKLNEDNGVDGDTYVSKPDHKLRGSLVDLWRRPLHSDIVIV